VAALVSIVDSVITASLLASPALLLAALGGMIHHRTGVVNIALEGQILAGAFVGMIVADHSRHLIFGFLAAAGIGLVLGWLTTLCVTRLGGNEIIVGLGSTTLLVGLIGYLLDDWFGSSGTYRPDHLSHAYVFGVPALQDVPVLGPLLGGHDLVVWATPLVCVATALALSSTRIGLRARSIGEDPRTATNLGIPTDLYREGAGALAGLMAAVGGAHLATIASGLFNVDMSAGRGFIALAAVYFGRGRVAMTVFPAMLFVVFDAAQRRIQTTGIEVPAQLIQTLPYVAVIAALALPTLRPRARALATGSGRKEAV